MRIFYAQSGGVTSVINATCAGLLKKAREYNFEVLIGLDGIHSIFENKVLSSKDLTLEDIDKLAKTPGGSFGSCRYKLTKKDYPTLISFLRENSIDVFTYHGGNDSMDTCLKVSEHCREKNLPIQVIGLPKTIDNDLFGTDQCPGFASTAKYLVNSFDEALLDLQSMCRDSTKVFILETMGRHTGWLAASCGLTQYSQQSHLILTPEKKIDIKTLSEKISSHVKKTGFCAIAMSEGAHLFNTTEHSGSSDAFGHQQLGGISLHLKRYLEEKCQLKAHVAIPDYLQRSAGHMISKVDFDQAWKIGSSLLDLLAKKDLSGQMIVVERFSSSPYKWEINSVPLSKVANKERMLPESFINENFQLTEQAFEYFKPLIQGEVEQNWINGQLDYWPHRLSLI